jgi:hypothetical protein
MTLQSTSHTRHSFSGLSLSQHSDVLQRNTNTDPGPTFGCKSYKYRSIADRLGDNALQSLANTDLVNCAGDVVYNQCRMYVADTTPERYRTAQRSIPCRLGRFQKLQYLVHQSITLTRLEYELCVGRALQDYKMLRRRHFLVVFAHFCQSNRTAPVRVVARHDE